MPEPQAPPAALIFDLDGTLVDSRTDLTTAVNAVRASLSLAPLTPDAVGTMIGDGARWLVRRAMADAMDQAAADAHFPAFLEQYTAVCTDATVPYPGVPEMLRDLSAREPAAPMAVLTNKPEAMSRTILDALDLSPLFARLIGGDTLPVRKPDPTGLRQLADGFGVPVARTMLIGDSPVDARTAAAAGSRFALCEWGFADPAALAAIDNAEIRAGDVRRLHTALLAALAAV